jgi:carbonic anhydrase
MAKKPDYSLDCSTSLKNLREGNERFITGMRALAPMMSQSKMAELAEKGQKPFAIVLTCSDSRSPVELIFDQGVGDLFVVRVAGNVVAPSLLASIEFAAANFGSPLIVVLGHTKCGAVNATISQVLDPRPLPSPHLEELVGRIRPAVENVRARERGNDNDLLQQSTVANVYRSLNLIMEQSSIIRKLHEEGRIMLTGGILDISTGKVKFIDYEHGE